MLELCFLYAQMISLFLYSWTALHVFSFLCLKGKKKRKRSSVKIFTHMHPQPVVKLLILYAHNHTPAVYLPKNLVFYKKKNLMQETKSSTTCRSKHKEYLPVNHAWSTFTAQGNKDKGISTVFSPVQWLSKLSQWRRRHSSLLLLSMIASSTKLSVLYIMR